MELTNVKDLSKGIYTTYVKNRIVKNKNFLVSITGPTGSGKTYSALTFAIRWDDDFTVANIVFSLEEFIFLINGKTLKSGSVIVFEEAGVAMNNRKWQSFENNMIQYILQTFRHKNYIVIFTAPDFGFIDSASRKLMHAHFMTQGIDFKLKVCNIKPYLLQINQRTGNIYYKFLKANIKDRGQLKINKISVTMPPKQLIIDYEVKKKEFTTKLTDDIETQLMAKLTEKKTKALDKNIRLEKFAQIRSEREKGTTWAGIGAVFNQTGDAIRKWYVRKSKMDKMQAA